MNNIVDPKQSVLKILEIINYQDNRDVFADDFLFLIQQEMLARLIESLSEEKRQELERELGEKPSPELIHTLLNKYFSEQQKAETTEQVTAETFKDFFKSIIPTLSGQQKTKLQAYLDSLKN